MTFICDLTWAEKLSMKQNRNHHNNYENNNYISKKFFACMTLLNFFVVVARIKKSNATYIVWYHTFRVLGKMTIRRMRLKLQLLYSNNNGTWKTIMFICPYNITRAMWLEILLIGWDLTRSPNCVFNERNSMKDALFVWHCWDTQSVLCLFCKK